MGWGFEPFCFQIKGKDDPECSKNWWPGGTEGAGTLVDLLAIMNLICSRPPVSRPFGSVLSCGLWPSPYDLLWPTGQMKAENGNVPAHSLGPALLLLLEPWDYRVSEAGLACWRVWDHMAQSLLSPCLQPESQQIMNEVIQGHLAYALLTNWPQIQEQVQMRSFKPGPHCRAAQLTQRPMRSNKYSSFEPLNLGAICYAANTRWCAWEQLSNSQTDSTYKLLTCFLKIQIPFPDYNFLQNKINTESLLGFSKTKQNKTPDLIWFQQSLN